MILKRPRSRYGVAIVSSREYRPPGRPAPTASGLEHEDPLAREPGDEPGLARGSLRLPRVAAPDEPEPHDPAMTRAPTEPMPPDLLAIAVARAVGTDPPPLRQRLPAPAASTMVVVPIAPPSDASAAPRLARASTPTPTEPAREPPTARMVAFGNTTILLVPAGDRIALVVPGVLRLTATRAEALALAELLRAVAKP